MLRAQDSLRLYDDFSRDLTSLVEKAQVSLARPVDFPKLRFLY